MSSKTKVGSNNLKFYKPSKTTFNADQLKAKVKNWYTFFNGSKILIDMKSSIEIRLFYKGCHNLGCLERLRRRVFGRLSVLNTAFMCVLAVNRAF